MTQQELIMRAINNGIKLRFIASGAIIQWNKDRLAFISEGAGYAHSPHVVLESQGVEEYIEPPKKVKKTYYRGYSTIANEQDIIYETTFMSDRNKLLNGLSTHQIIKIEEKEFEI